MKTLRRDKLMRDVAKGLYLAKSVFTHDAMNDSIEYGDGVWKLARIRHPKFETYTNQVGNTQSRCADPDLKPGHFNMDEFDFRSSSGSAWIENGIVTLHVHSNCVYELKRVVA